MTARPSYRAEPCAVATLQQSANAEACAVAIRNDSTNAEACAVAIRSGSANAEACKVAIRSGSANAEACKVAIRSGSADVEVMANTNWSCSAQRMDQKIGRGTGADFAAFKIIVRRDRAESLEKHLAVWWPGE
jgi:hypothetical protein